MKSGGVEVVVVVSWFVMQCGDDVATVKFHHGVQEINLLTDILKNLFDGGVEVGKVLMELPLFISSELFNLPSQQQCPFLSALFPYSLYLNGLIPFYIILLLS